MVSDEAGVRVRVPAKINVALCVGAERPDGYHPLTTVFQAVSLFDDLVVTRAEPGEFSLSIAGDAADDVPTGRQNLALRAARLLAQRFDATEEVGVSMQLRKAIPVAGGMAGGSADAAAALLACSVLWDLDVELEELRELGAEIGSDVPFPLLGGTALGTGRGEQLVPVLTRGSYHWVLAFAKQGLSTPAVFRRFDERGEVGALDVPTDLLDALGSADPAGVAKALRNDLAPAALDLMPELADTLAVGESYGAIASLISGSGPTVAFLTAGEADAVELSTKLASWPGIRGVRRVQGPVCGAKVVSG